MHHREKNRQTTVAAISLQVTREGNTPGEAKIKSQLKVSLTVHDIRNFMFEESEKNEVECAGKTEFPTAGEAHKATI